MRYHIHILLLASVFCVAYCVEAGENKKPVQYNYTVVKGDTLWDISDKYLKNPKGWPDIWKENKHIYNPNLIYPGNGLNIPGKRSFNTSYNMPTDGKSRIKKKREFSERKTDKSEDDDLGMLSGRKLQKGFGNKVSISITTGASPKAIKRRMLISCGFIVKEDNIPSGIIKASKLEGNLIYEHRVAHAVSDTLNLLQGATYTVFRYDRKVYHPNTSKFLGTLVRILGEAKVLKKHNKLMEIIITKSYREIKPGDRLMSIVRFDAPAKITKGKDVSGTIVDGYGDKHVFAEGDYVYIDLGNADGVQAGEMYTIYRTSEQYDYGDTNHLGELQSEAYVEVGKFISLFSSNTTTSGFIYRSSLPVEVGFRIR